MLRRSVRPQRRSRVIEAYPELLQEHESGPRFWFVPDRLEPADVIFQVSFSEQQIASFDGLGLPVHGFTYDKGRVDLVNVALSDLVMALEEAGDFDAMLYFKGIDEYARATRSTYSKVPTISFVAERGVLSPHNGAD